MGAGRKPMGARLVDGLEGSAQAKERLRVILETLAGERTIEEACAQLDVASSYFHKLRERTLQEMVQGLEPRKPGRAAKAPDVEAIESERTELAGRVRSLERDLAKSRVQTELARMRAAGGEKKERWKRR